MNSRRDHLGEPQSNHFCCRLSSRLAFVYLSRVLEATTGTMRKWLVCSYRLPSVSCHRGRGGKSSLRVTAQGGEGLVVTFRHRSAVGPGDLLPRWKGVAAGSGATTRGGGLFRGQGSGSPGGPWDIPFLLPGSKAREVVGTEAHLDALEQPPAHRPLRAVLLHPVCTHLSARACAGWGAVDEDTGTRRLFALGGGFHFWGLCDGVAPPLYSTLPWAAFFLKPVY